MTARPVAVVTSTIPVTIATFHQELLRQLGAAGYDVLVVSSPGPHLATLAESGLARVAAIPMQREITPRADLVALRQWISLMRAERPRLVVAATPKASLLAMLVARLHRVPRRLYFLSGLRLEGDTGLRRQVLTLVERVTGGAASEVVANSPSMAARAIGLRLFRASKLRQTVPGSSHGVDATYFTPQHPDPALAEELGLTSGLPVLGFVGRMTHDKGVDTLLGAVRLLSDEGVDVQLLVVGAQDEPDSQEALARLRASAVPVTTTGAVSDVRPYFALMDLHVLPSLREGFPNVVLEAAAMGLATVTTDATGCVDSVRDGVTGLVVPVRDPQRLASAVRDLINDPDRRREMGASARTWVAADFRPPAVVRSLLGDLVDEERAVEGAQ